jgi:hypothetical protein
MKLTTHLYLVPKLRMRGAIPPLSQLRFHVVAVKHMENYVFTPQYVHIALLLNYVYLANTIRKYRINIG